MIRFIRRRSVLSTVVVVTLLAGAATVGLLFAYDLPALSGSADATDPGQERPAQQEPTVYQHTELPPIETEPPRHPNLDSNLNDLAGRSPSETRTASTSAQQETPVLVRIAVSPDSVADVQEWLEDNGIYVRNVGDDYIEAHIPPSRLVEASEQPGVSQITTIAKPRRNQSRGRVISQGVGLHGADAWHSAGYRGQQVRVGIIDVGFDGIRTLLGSELPSTVVARCYFEEARAPSSALADCENGDDHGTAVAETAHDVAPGAALYAANPVTPADFRGAVNWMAGQGVKVINVSLGWVVEGPGDGSSPYSDSYLKTIEHGVSQDVVWSLAAGNHARQSWYGEFVNADGDNAHEWVAGDELNWFLAREGEDVRGFMRWDDDWGGADCDLNLVLVGEAANGSPANIKISTGQQNGSARAVPLEYVEYGPLTAKQEGWYSWAITNSTCATLPSWMQLFAWINDDLEHYSPSHQMGNPEESRSAGALTVGVTHYQDTYAIAPYSAKGPTVDGRTKPDITGIACGLSTTIPGGPLGDGTQCWFSGTSQSAPHVAGLAALVRQRFPTYTASEVVAYMQRHASDRGAPNADNTWGSGLATLPNPQQTTPVAPPPATGAILRTQNLAVRDGANSGEVVLSWDVVSGATYYRVGYVDMVNDYPIAKANPSGQWQGAFWFQDVNALDATIVDGRAEYTIKRLERVSHAFTVQTSADVTRSGEFWSGHFGWPTGGYWIYHTPR